MRILTTIDDTIVAIATPIKSVANATATSFNLLDGYVNRLNREQNEKDYVHKSGSKIRQELLKTEFLTTASLRKIALNKELQNEEVKEIYSELEELFNVEA